MAKHRGLDPVVLAEPEPGDFCCIPISGGVGMGIEIAQFLSGNRLQPYDHAQVYVGQADSAGPNGYTYSAYPDNGKNGRTGKRALPCPARELPGAIWSSGIIDLTEAQRQGIVAWCEAHPSVLYSAADYLAIGLKRMGLRTKELKAYIASSKRMICSYYSDAAFLWGAGVHLFNDGRWPGEVTPGDLAEMLQTEAHLKSLTPQE